MTTWCTSRHAQRADTCRGSAADAPLQVNSLVSAKSALPIEYYSLPFCRPAKIVSSAENLGEVLRGDRIYNSLYQVRRPLRQRVRHRL